MSLPPHIGKCVILYYVMIFFMFQVLTPVIDLKSKTKDEDESIYESPSIQPKTLTASLNVRDFDWNVANEYDPMWPNDYEKVAKG